MVTLAVPTQAAPLAQTVPGGTVNWAATPQIITSVTRHNFPWVAVDNNDKTHVVFITPASGTEWDIRYVNNVGGTFSGPGTLIDTIFKNPAVPSAIIMAGPSGVLHLIYTLISEDASDPVYYRQSTNNGATWSARQLISSGGKSATPSMVVDPLGNAHITWINNGECSGTYNVYYRVRFANGTLSGISKPKDACATYQNRPAITFAGGKPHIAFQHGTSLGAEIYHARLEGTQWIDQNITTGPFNSQNPTLASDGGNNLFFAWDENIDNANHEILFKASFDGGVTWSAPNRFTNNPGISTYPYISWSASSQRAFIIWHDQNSAVGVPEEVWLREFNPADRTTTAAFQASKSGGSSTQPKIAFGPSRADLVWQDNSTATYQIYDLAGQLLGGGCSGSVVLAGGAEQTKSGQVPAAITPTCPDAGTPDTMQISIDAPPASTTNPPQVPFNANPSITMTDGGCLHTVYVRLFKNGTSGQAFSDSIKVDDIVNASVLVANPNMVGLPLIYTSDAAANAQAIGPADAYEGGATNGDPNYTRVRKFFLSINDNNDCTGLGDFYIPGSDTVQPEQIPDAGFAGSPALPGFGTAGKKDFTVVVSDTIGNQLASPVSLVYDPNRPTLNGGSVSGDTNTKTVLRTLSFSAVNVTDDLYGPSESLPAGQQFWGVWVTNIHVTATPNITPDNPGLNWLPVPVTSPAAQFSFEWSLFSGLDYGIAQDKSGNYQVLVRFLDGAGNPTQGVISTTLTLDSGYTMPQLFLPAINR
jgi:hypothetical protein